MLELCIGKSMSNILSLKLIRTEKAQTYNIGDIIIFKGNDHHKYVHRIIKIDSKKFTTKGDNFNEIKKYETDVPVKNIQGRVTWSWPKSKIMEVLTK